MKPWRWHRGQVSVLLRPNGVGELRMHEFPGIIHGPFGIYRYGFVTPFHLIHVLTGCTLTSLPLQRQCKALAVELAGCAMNWQENDPEKVPGEDIKRVASLLREAERAAMPDPRYR